MKYLFRFLKGTHQGPRLPVSVYDFRTSYSRKATSGIGEGAKRDFVELMSWNSQARPEC
jgi:hypothetical protein